MNHGLKTLTSTMTFSTLTPILYLGKTANTKRAEGYS